jgi:hypothetical protein
MQGIPRILQTRADFDLALDMARAGQADRLLVALHFKGLVEAAHKYVFDRALSDGEMPDGPPPEYWVIEPSETDPRRIQEKRVTDPEARLFALGYTLADVEAIINELEA